MFDRWIADWARTGIGARIALVVFAIGCLLLATDGAIYNLERRDYPNAAAEIIVLALLLLVFVVWPYRIAWAVRRRGGSFNLWLTLALIFSFIWVGIAYRIKWHSQPILPEEA